MRSFCIVIVLFGASAVFGQPRGWVEVPQIRRLLSDPVGCGLEGGLYDKEKLRAAIEKRPNCQERLAALDVDHENESLVYYHTGGDCHMRVTIKVFRVDDERKYKVILNNIYGGCRAGGRRSGWVVIDKLPPGYDLEMHEVRIDRIHGPIRDEAFTFPKPLSVITSESLETREVDLTGCLPLTGQSQWILRSREQIERALNESDKGACLARIDSLGVDLATHMFAGFSFATGHCRRPLGMEFQAVKETSTDPTENRFVVRAAFDKPRVLCRAWTTTPVWLVIPRLPEGYSIKFEAKPRS